MDLPTRKSSALKSDRDMLTAGITRDNMSSNAHMKYKIPSTTRRTCAHLLILGE